MSIGGRRSAVFHPSRTLELRSGNRRQTTFFIADRWRRDSPWTWQQKHLLWFLNHCLNGHAQSTCYYFVLTMRFLTKRLGRSWQFGPRQYRAKQEEALRSVQRRATSRHHLVRGRCRMCLSKHRGLAPFFIIDFEGLINMSRRKA